MKRLVLAPLVLALVGCDGGFGVRGSAMAPGQAAPDKCVLSIIDPSDALHAGDGPVNPQNIQTHFTVAPSDATYTLSLQCAGFKPHIVKVLYGEDVSPSKPLDLGQIVLVPQS